MKIIKCWLWIFATITIIQVASLSQEPEGIVEQPEVGAQAGDIGMPGVDYPEGELLIEFAGGPKVPLALAAHAQTGARVVRDFDFVGCQHIRLPEGMTVVEGIARYEKMPGVLAVSPNHFCQASKIPNDPFFPDQNNLHDIDYSNSTAYEIDLDIDAPEAWDVFTGTSNVVVGVIDSGWRY